MYNIFNYLINITLDPKKILNYILHFEQQYLFKKLNNSIDSLFK